MFTSFPVLLDGATLAPHWQRKLLLACADHNLYRPIWTPEGLSFLTEALGAEGVPEPSAVAEALKTLFPDAEARDHDALATCMVGEVGDKLCLAAAVKSHAQVIVTPNPGRFSTSALQPYHIEAKAPDEFLMDLLGRYPNEINSCLDFLIVHAAKCAGKPALSKYEVLQCLGKNSPNFAASALVLYKIA